MSNCLWEIVEQMNRNRLVVQEKSATRKLLSMKSSVDDIYRKSRGSSINSIRGIFISFCCPYLLVASLTSCNWSTSIAKYNQVGWSGCVWIVSTVSICSGCWGRKQGVIHSPISCRWTGLKYKYTTDYLLKPILNQRSD
jgi:hypothetical protein